MNISGLSKKTDKSNSIDSNPAHFNNPPQSNIKYSQSNLGLHMPENGGMLKKAIRFEYEFSNSAKIQAFDQEQRREPQPEVKPFTVNSPVKLQKTESQFMPKKKRQVMMPSANMFSCMDTPDYQRDFQISPKIIQKE